MPFFSLIIPTFNSEKTIRQCLTSILDQSEPDFEIIIQDGCSTDATVRTAEDFGDSRIRIFKEADTGIYDAMNKAVNRIMGTWILFLGSDDRLYDTEILHHIKSSLVTTKADLVYGNVQISGDSHWIKDGAIYMGETNIPLLFFQNLSHQAIFYHRKVFDFGNRFNVHYKVCADHDLNLYCFSAFHTQYIPLIISIFRTGGMSTVQQDFLFEEEKWMLIVKYFSMKLFNPSLRETKRHLKKAGQAYWKKRNYRLSLVAYTAYFYQKLFGKRKRIS